MSRISESALRWITAESLLDAENLTPPAVDQVHIPLHGLFGLGAGPAGAHVEIGLEILYFGLAHDSPVASDRVGHHARGLDSPRTHERQRLFHFGHQVLRAAGRGVEVV